MRRLVLAVLVLLLPLAGCQSAPEETAAEISPASLPSWNDVASRAQILEFLERTTTEGSADFVAPEDRIAVFDNDGTLWSEQPAYFQLMFVRDRVREMLPQHPEWQGMTIYEAALSDDPAKIRSIGSAGMMELVTATHAGMTPEEFTAIVRPWIETAKHPRFDRKYTELVFQPMLELMDLLRAHGYRVYIVSGGGITFLRAWAEEVYGVIPQQVIGSMLVLEYTEESDGPVLRRAPRLDTLNDGPGKPVQIMKFIGQRPTIAVGNSDGDYEMLAWTTAGSGPRLGMLIHHTDADREWAYDKESSVGRLQRGLDDAGRRGWVVVDMKTDWGKVYPWQ